MLRLVFASCFKYNNTDTQANCIHFKSCARLKWFSFETANTSLAVTAEYGSPMNNNRSRPIQDKSWLDRRQTCQNKHSLLISWMDQDVT